MSLPEPIERPNGKLYRPRRIVAHEVADEDGITGGVVILGTHDQDRAQILANQMAEYVAGRGYVAASPETGWFRDGFEGGERRWVRDEAEGRAGVLFREIVETAPAGLAVTS